MNKEKSILMGLKVVGMENRPQRAYKRKQINQRMEKFVFNRDNQEMVKVAYPFEAELYYKFIYKYERFVGEKKSDKEIEKLVNLQSALTFSRTLARIKTIVNLYGPKDNKKINKLLKESCHDDRFAYTLRLERATAKETKLHCLLRHFRNTIAHASFNDSEECLELTDMEETGRLTAYGFIDKSIFLDFIKSFTA